jgi:hypothetical protein
MFLAFLLTFVVMLPQCVTSAPASVSVRSSSTTTTTTKVSTKTTTTTTTTAVTSTEISTEKYFEDMQATQALACNSLEPPFLKTEDKIVLAPIVFQGKLECFINVETLFVAK